MAVVQLNQPMRRGGGGGGRGDGMAVEYHY